MLKRTLYFGSPAYLSTSNFQLVVTRPGEQGTVTIPIEDVGIVILDNSQITLTHPLIVRLLENNVAIVHCDHQHMPFGMMLCLEGHTLQSQRFRQQIEASLPLKKRMWQQTVAAKIRNQAALLVLNNEEDGAFLQKMSTKVSSGDKENLEARAAAFYWPRVFPNIPDFRRERTGEMPNSLLNYAYAIIRGVIARALSGSGILPTLGIHHRNQYNAYCLADDIMEPYRPFADALVRKILEEFENPDIEDKEVKKRLLTLPAIDVVINNQMSPLMVAASRTSASINRCFEGSGREIKYPDLAKTLERNKCF